MEHCKHCKDYFEARHKTTVSDWTAGNRFFDSIKEKRDGKNLAEWQNTQPQEQFRIYDNEAVTAGASMFSAHQSKKQNPNHPEHEKALKLDAEKFNNDPNVALYYFTDYARKTMGAQKRHIPNMAYENSLFSKMSFVTPDDNAFGYKLRIALNKKWDAVGYDFDDEFIEAFINDHPFSKDPRNQGFTTINATVVDPMFKFQRPGAMGMRKS
jgi:hypothetical protein